VFGTGVSGGMLESQSE